MFELLQSGEMVVVEVLLLGRDQPSPSAESVASTRRMLWYFAAVAMTQLRHTFAFSVSLAPTFSQRSAWVA